MRSRRLCSPDRSRTPPHFPGNSATASSSHHRGGAPSLALGTACFAKPAAAHPDIVWPAESTMSEVLKRSGASPQTARAHAAVCAAFALVEQSHLVRRFQRLVPHRRRNALRSADHHRRAQPLSAALPHRAQSRHAARGRDFRRRLSPARIAAGDPRFHRQRRLRQAAPGRPQPRVDAMVKLGIVLNACVSSPQDNGRVHERTRH